MYIDVPMDHLGSFGIPNGKKLDIHLPGIPTFTFRRIQRRQVEVPVIVKRYVKEEVPETPEVPCR
jgi:hypothetical protein